MHGRTYSNHVPFVIAFVTGWVCGCARLGDAVSIERSSCRNHPEYWFDGEGVLFLRIGISFVADSLVSTLRVVQRMLRNDLIFACSKISFSLFGG